MKRDGRLCLNFGQAYRLDLPPMQRPQGGRCLGSVRLCETGWRSCCNNDKTASRCSDLLVLNAYWVGLSFMWNSLHVIILPAVLLLWFPSRSKTPTWVC